MQDLQRINVKLYLEDPTALSAKETFRIFNSWIPTTPDEVLIDVADYSHVPDGPVTLLVGHDAINHFGDLLVSESIQTTRPLI